MENCRNHMEKIRKNGTALAFFAALLWILLWAGSVHAEAERITFIDGSGMYLESSENGWILKNKAGRIRKGLQYVAVRKSGPVTPGYYVFDSRGQMNQKKAVYRFRKKTVRGELFDGYYLAASSTGRIPVKAAGLVYLKNVKCSGKTFTGYYYADRLGKLSTDKAMVRYLKKTVIKGTAFRTGYYYFNSAGKLVTEAGFHTVKKQKAGKIRFDGQYYFAEGGILYTKAGIIEVKGKLYCLTKEGQKVVNAWKLGYYFLNNGQMAVSMKVPDGSYVGPDGRIVKPEEIRLLPLKAQLEAAISGYGGTWSVYVKDLKTDDFLSINPQKMYPASTIKLFAMAYAFELVKEEKLANDAVLLELMTYMITESDNNCFNTLVSMFGGGDFLTGARALNTYLKNSGYKETEVHHTAKPAGVFITDGGTNTGTAKDCGLLLERIAKGKCVNNVLSAAMMNLMRGQTRRWKIPAALPPQAVVANKTGETDEVQHDVAVVSGPKTDYVICVFSTSSDMSGINGIKAISKAVWDFLE